MTPETALPPDSFSALPLPDIAECALPLKHHSHQSLDDMLATIREEGVDITPETSRQLGKLSAKLALYSGIMAVSETGTNHPGLGGMLFAATIAVGTYALAFNEAGKTTDTHQPENLGYTNSSRMLPRWLSRRP